MQPIVTAYQVESLRAIDAATVKLSEHFGEKISVLRHASFKFARIWREEANREVRVILEGSLFYGENGEETSVSAELHLMETSPLVGPKWWEVQSIWLSVIGKYDFGMSEIQNFDDGRRVESSKISRLPI